MHELGIVLRVIDQAERAARENDVKKITRLTLEVGEVSSVLPDLFADCFAWAQRKTEFLQEAKLELIPLAARSYCRACRRTYPTTEYARRCPRCRSDDTYLLTGDEIIIKEMEVL